MRMDKRGIALAVTLGFTLLAGCGPRGGEKAEGGAGGEKAAGAAGPAGATQPAAVVATPVRVAPAREEVVTRTIPVTGSTSALQTVDLSAKIAARVVSVIGREGERVNKGQVVVQQDTTDLNAQLQQAQANLQASEANLRSAQARLAQTETQARLQVTTSSVGIRDAEQQVASAQEQLALAKRPQRTQEINVAENAVSLAQANYERATSDRQRYEALVKEGAAPQITLDQYVNQEKVAKAALDTAREQLQIAQTGGRAESVRQAEAAVRRAEAQLRLARANRQQIDVREDDIRAARAAVAQARAQVAQQQATVRIARQAITDASLRSPINGVISERLTEPGQQAAPGAAVMRLISLDTVYFEAQVAETELNSVKVGQPVTVRLDAYPGRVFTGKVARINPTGSTSSRTFNVRVNIPNNAGALRPGLFARGEVVAEQRRGVVVPKDALVVNEGQFSVFVAKAGGTAERREVEVGVQTPATAEIRRGVQPGEQVIVAGQNALKSGGRIDIKTGSGQGAQQALAQ